MTEITCPVLGTFLTCTQPHTNLNIRYAQNLLGANFVDVRVRLAVDKKSEFGTPVFREERDGNIRRFDEAGSSEMNREKSNDVSTPDA